MSDPTTPFSAAGIDPSKFDLNDTNSLKVNVVNINIAFITLVAVVTVLRMSIRLFMVRTVGLDDYLMVLAAIFAILVSSFLLLGSSQGLGTHIWVLAQKEPTKLIDITKHLTQTLYVSYISYTTAITLTKCSIIFSYLRIFPAQNTKLRGLLLTTLALVIAMWICSIFTIIFQCNPVRAAWDWSIENGRCIDILSFFYVSSSINFVTELILWIAPLPCFWAMNMRMRERVLLCVLFSFAAFACVASMLRISQLHGLHSMDITHDAVPSANWSVAEVGTAIICASVPSMRPLAKILLPRWFFTTITGSRHSSAAATPSQHGAARFDRESRFNSGDEIALGERPDSTRLGEGNWGEVRSDSQLGLRDLEKDVGNGRGRGSERSASWPFTEEQCSPLKPLEEF